VCAKVSQKGATKRNQHELLNLNPRDTLRCISSLITSSRLVSTGSLFAQSSPSLTHSPTNFLHALSGTFYTHIHPIANTTDQSAQCVKSCKISCSCCEWPVVPRPRDLVFQVWSEPRSRMRCINRTLYMICRLKFLVAASCTEIRAVWMLRRNMG
jgi:hypothetical protein